jgi:hypothetical protein
MVSLLLLRFVTFFSRLQRESPLDEHLDFFCGLRPIRPTPFFSCPCTLADWRPAREKNGARAKKEDFGFTGGAALVKIAETVNNLQLRISV